MECPACKQDLRISNTAYGVKDGKPYVFQSMVCINKRCTNYAGVDLAKPAKVVRTEEHELGGTA